MPPSRELTAIIDQEVLGDVEKALDLRGPVTVKVTTTRENRCYGTYTALTRRVRLNLGMGVFERSGVAGVSTEVLITFLHELRHAHQYDHWTPREYNDHSKIEADAEAWAQQNAAYWRALVKVKAKYPVSNLRRLAKSERSARA